jgi:hypothetical protein
VIEESSDAGHGSPHLLALSRSDLPSVGTLISHALGCHLPLVELVFLLIALLELRVEVLPHVSDDPGDFGHAQVGMLFLDALVDVDAIEEECAEGLLGRLRRADSIVKSLRVWGAIITCQCHFSSVWLAELLHKL